MDDQIVVIIVAAPRILECDHLPQLRGIHLQSREVELLGRKLTYFDLSVFRHKHLGRTVGRSDYLLVAAHDGHMPRLDGNGERAGGNNVVHIQIPCLRRAFDGIVSASREYPRDRDEGEKPFHIVCVVYVSRRKNNKKLILITRNH